jgi:hypothetical protein
LLDPPTFNHQRFLAHRDVEKKAAMRIYFHLKNANEVLLDVEGVEVSDPREARAQAALVIEELRPTDVQCWSGWTLTAVDAGGGVLFSVDLDSNVWSAGAWLLSLLLLQGSELRKHLVHVPDIFPGIALLV